MIILCLVFWGTFALFIYSECLNLFSIVREGSLFSTPSSAFVICRLLNDGHSCWCEVVPHCSFNLHFSNNSWCWPSFHVPTGHPYVFFEEMSIKVFCSFSNWVVFLLLLWNCMSCLYILKIKPFRQSSYYKCT